MSDWEGKKYKLEKSENFEEYMKALGEFLEGILWNFKLTKLQLKSSSVFVVLIEIFVKSKQWMFLQ